MDIDVGNFSIEENSPPAEIMLTGTGVSSFDLPLALLLNITPPSKFVPWRSGFREKSVKLTA